jgi:hypothetical protein
MSPYRELVIDGSRMHTHDKDGDTSQHGPGHRHAGRPTKHLQPKADNNYRKHTLTYKALNTAFFPVIADTVGSLHEDAVRLLYHAVTVKASGNVDNEGLWA